MIQIIKKLGRASTILAGALFISGALLVMPRSAAAGPVDCAIIWDEGFIDCWVPDCTTNRPFGPGCCKDFGGHCD